MNQNQGTEFAIKVKRLSTSTSKIQISDGNTWQTINGSMDSGAERTVAGFNQAAKYCRVLEEPRKIKQVELPGGGQYQVSKVGRANVRVLLSENVPYDFGEITIFLVADDTWNDFLIGEDVLELHGLLPEQALNNKMQNTNNNQYQN